MAGGGESLVEQVAVGVMFDHEAGTIPPIIEDLAAKDMATHTPELLPPLLLEPFAAHHHFVRILHLERAMMHMRGRRFEKKDAVVVDPLVSLRHTQKCGNILVVRGPREGYPMPACQDFPDNQPSVRA